MSVSVRFFTCYSNEAAQVFLLCPIAYASVFLIQPVLECHCAVHVFAGESTGHSGEHES